MQVAQILLVAGRGQLAVGLQTQLVRVDVVHRNGGLQGQVDADGDRLGPPGLLVLFHRLGDHAHVKVEADPLDVAGLLVAQQVAGAAQLQILHGHVVAGPQGRVLGDGGQPVVGGLGHGLAGVVEEVGVGALPAASHPAAQLMELGEPEAVGPVHNQRVGVGNIQAGLDDGRADQHIDVPVPEVADDPVQLLLPHLAVGHAHLGLGDQRLHLGRDLADVLHPVVNIEDLAPAQELAANGRRHLGILVGAHIGQHRQTILGGRGQGGHLPDAGHRHLQGARNGRGRQGQDVHVGPHGLEGLLGLHAEALLLVHDHQTQILEADARVEQLVGADDHVHGPAGQALHGGLVLLGGLEAAHGGHIHREALEALGEGLVVLLDQQGRGHQDHHLLAVLNGLEGGADGYFGLAEAHIPADQAVHGHRLLHIGLDLVDGGQLVGSLLVGEGILQLLLPGGVRAEGEALGALPGRVELDQALGDLVDVLAGLGLGGRPVGSAQLVEPGNLGADVATDLIQLVGRYEELVWRGIALGGGVLQDQILPAALAGAHAHAALAHAQEAADAVLVVDHVVAGLELVQVDGLAPAVGGLAACGHAGAPGQVPLGQQGQMGGLVHEAVHGQGAVVLHPDNTSGLHGPAQTAQGSLGRSGHHNPVAALQQGGDARGGPILVAAVLVRSQGIQTLGPLAVRVHRKVGQLPDLPLAVLQG